MKKIFLSKKVNIPVVIILSGVLIAAGVFLFSDFNKSKSLAVSDINWTQQTGEGIMAPACNSSSPISFCDGAQAKATISWTVSPHVPRYGDVGLFYGEGGWADISLSDGRSVNNQPMAGSITFDVNDSTSYTYNIVWSGHLGSCEYRGDIWGCWWDGYGRFDSTSGSFSSPLCAVGAIQLRETLDSIPRQALDNIVMGYKYNGQPQPDYIGTIPVDFPGMPAGKYDVSYKSGGPPGADFKDITPSSVQNLLAGGTITFTFNFVSPPQTLSVSKSGTGSGTVTSNPAGISCGSDCSETYNYGTSVTLTASPSAGSGFTGWSGEGCSGTGTCTVTMTQARSVTTTFNLLLPGDFILNPPSAACNSVSLSWTASTYADAYKILRVSPRVDISPYQPYTALYFTDTGVSQGTDYKYQIEAYNTVGDNRSNVRNVTTPYCPPACKLSGDPLSIYQGQTSTLTWKDISYATSCTASGAWSGSKSISGGSETVTPAPPSATYYLTCSGPGGSTQCLSPVTVNVSPLALPGWREIIPR